jgi:hypothetical protein
VSNLPTGVEYLQKAVIILASSPKSLSERLDEAARVVFSFRGTYLYKNVIDKWHDAWYEAVDTDQLDYHAERLARQLVEIYSLFESAEED